MIQKALDFPAACSFTSRKTSVGTEGEKKEILAMRSLTVFWNQDFKTFLSLVTEGLNQNRQVSDNFTACPLMTRTFKLWFKTNLRCNSLQTDLSHAFVTLLGLQIPVISESNLYVNSSQIACTATSALTVRSLSLEERAVQKFPPCDADRDVIPPSTGLLNNSLATLCVGY